MHTTVQQGLSTATRTHVSEAFTSPLFSPTSPYPSTAPEDTLSPVHQLTQCGKNVTHLGHTHSSLTVGRPGRGREDTRGRCRSRFQPEERVRDGRSIGVGEGTPSSSLPKGHLTFPAPQLPGRSVWPFLCHCSPNCWISTGFQWVSPQRLGPHGSGTGSLWIL